MVLCVLNIIQTSHSINLFLLLVNQVSSFGPDLVVGAFIILVLWVMVSGVIEFTIMVLRIQVASDSVGNSQEV